MLRYVKQEPQVGCATETCLLQSISVVVRSRSGSIYFYDIALYHMFRTLREGNFSQCTTQKAIHLQCEANKTLAIPGERQRGQPLSRMSRSHSPYYDPNCGEVYIRLVSDLGYRSVESIGVLPPPTNYNPNCSKGDTFLSMSSSVALA